MRNLVVGLSVLMVLLAIFCVGIDVTRGWEAHTTVGFVPMYRIFSALGWGLIAISNALIAVEYYHGYKIL